MASAEPAEGGRVGRGRSGRASREDVPTFRRHHKTTDDGEGNQSGHRRTWKVLDNDNYRSWLGSGPPYTSCWPTRCCCEGEGQRNVLRARGPLRLKHYGRSSGGAFGRRETDTIHLCLHPHTISKATTLRKHFRHGPHRGESVRGLQNLVHHPEAPDANLNDCLPFIHACLPFIFECFWVL